MTPREHEEYRALRATIRERGTARAWVFVFGLSVWAGLALSVLVLTSSPAATLLPLFVLAGTFEVVFALHVSVERIGRYIQVFYEEQSTDRNWERTAMAFGQPLAGTGADPLFAVLFSLATLFNALTAVFGGATRVQLAVVGTAHILLLARIARARWSGQRQRTADLERFRQLKSPSAPQVP